MSSAKDTRRGWRIFEAVVNVLAVAFAAWCLFSLTGCGTVRYVDRVTVQHDTTRVVQRDSVRFYDRDSIYIREQGDTVYQYVEKWRWRDRVRIDTVLRVRIDSVAVIQRETVEVAKPLTKWQNAKIRAFWWLLAGLLAALLWIFRKPILKLFKL